VSACEPWYYLPELELALKEELEQVLSDDQERQMMHFVVATNPEIGTPTGIAPEATTGTETGATTGPLTRTGTSASRGAPGSQNC
jgi:hypothetical protein